MQFSFGIHDESNSVLALIVGCENRGGLAGCVREHDTAVLFDRANH
jgi:hypothetical protein